MEYKTKMLDPKFREDFVKEMELRFVARDIDQDFSCIDTIIDLCELFEVEPESVSSLIVGPFKMKLKDEAMKLNLIAGKPKRRLPME